MRRTIIVVSLLLGLIATSLISCSSKEDDEDVSSIHYNALNFKKFVESHYGSNEIIALAMDENDWLTPTYNDIWERSAVVFTKNGANLYQFDFYKYSATSKDGYRVENESQSKIGSVSVDFKTLQKNLFDYGVNSLMDVKSTADGEIGNTQYRICRNTGSYRDGFISFNCSGEEALIDESLFGNFVRACKSSYTDILKQLIVGTWKSNRITMVVNDDLSVEYTEGDETANYQLELHDWGIQFCIGSVVKKEWVTIALTDTLLWVSDGYDYNYSTLVFDRR